MEMVNKGRKIVIALIVIILLIDIIVGASVSSFYAENGTMDMASYKLSQGIIRFILTALLMFFLYKGHSLAKWLSVVLFGLAGLGSLIQLVLSFNAVSLAMGLAYIFFGAMLVASTSVNDFFRYQRGVFSDI